MNRLSFHIGDIVKSIVDNNEHNHYINTGTTGTIVKILPRGSVCVGVEWDVEPCYPFHACDGTAAPNRGYFVTPSSIELVHMPEHVFHPESFESLFDWR